MHSVFNIPQVNYRLMPDPEDIFRRALSAHQGGDLVSARRLYLDVLKQRPQHVDAQHFLGVAEGALGNPQLAIEHIQRAIAYSPQNASCYLNLGNVYRETGQIARAVECYEKALSLRPDYHMAYSNLGAIYEQAGEFRKAVQCYEKALAIHPDFPEAQWNLAALALLLGDFSNGWRLFESRWTVKAHAMRHTAVSGIRWTGEQALMEKRILIFAEQGLGDSIQFCRYALLLQERHRASVVLQVPAPLKRLVQTLGSDLIVIDDAQAPPPYDYYCPMASLPLAFGTELNSIPSFSRYLHADPRLRQEWHARLPTAKRPRVGLVWSGNPQHLNDHNRSVPLRQFLGALPDSCDYIALQKDARPDDLAALSAHPEVFQAAAYISDFADTAALCANLDAVVTVDTSVAHLAGALGLPTKVLIPFAPDWRWMLNRTDSPWYPSMELYRQAAVGDWTNALAALRNNLQCLSNTQ